MDADMDANEQQQIQQQQQLEQQRLQQQQQQLQQQQLEQQQQQQQLAQQQQQLQQAMQALAQPAKRNSPSRTSAIAPPRKQLHLSEPPSLPNFIPDYEDLPPTLTYTGEAAAAILQAKTPADAPTTPPIQPTQPDSTQPTGSTQPDNNNNNNNGCVLYTSDAADDM
eukprot:10764732-Karenia_brevis.AAC.1